MHPIALAVSKSWRQTEENQSAFKIYKWRMLLDKERIITWGSTIHPWNKGILSKSNIASSGVDSKSSILQARKHFAVNDYEISITKQRIQRIRLNLLNLILTLMPSAKRGRRLMASAILCCWFTVNSSSSSSSWSLCHENEK